MKNITIEEVASLVRDAGSLFLPGSTAQPNAFLASLAGRAGSLDGVSLTTGFVSGINDFAALEASDAKLTGFFPAPSKPDGSIRLLRETYFGIDRRIRTIACSAALIEVAPPSADGSCGFGVAADFAGTALSVAATRIAVINPNLPDLAHGPRVFLEYFTHVAKSASPILEIYTPEQDEVSKAIAAAVGRLVPYGATLQLGIGRIPSQVMRALSDHRGLRFHSGIITEGIRDLISAGALAPGQSIVAASFGGSGDFYEWLAGRPEFQLAPVIYTHAPATLARIDKLISINSALQVDLLGQVNAEWAGSRRISAPGGLPDFAHAAQRGRDGQAIIALSATDPSGRRSGIVARLEAPPTLPAGGVDLVVTEYGTADLRGKSSSERASALVSVAAPQFRDALAEAAEA